MRRAVSLLLAVCMVATMAAPAFAAAQEPIAAEPIVQQTEEQPQEEELPVEVPAEQPEAELPAEEPVEEPTETPAEAPVEEAAEEVAAEPAAELPAEVPAEEPQAEEKAVSYEYELLKNGISGATADSEKNPPSGNDGPATYAFDGNLSSMWHTNYGGQTTPFPHHIQWSVGEAKRIGKIVYYRRQDGNVNGRWKNVSVYGKNGENTDWSLLKENVEIPRDDASFTISFTPTEVTHLKVVINHTHDNDQFATASEIKTYQAVEAQANGVSKQALRDQYAAASEMNTTNYLPESVQKLTEALNAAKALIDRTDATAEEVKNAEKQLQTAVDGLQIDKNHLAAGAPESQTTQGQPFAVNTAGSKNFRIPSIITLKHGEHAGRLVAAIDARWNHTGDACALDTILSVSDDNGATWKYSFPNFFNDSVNAYTADATALIDPVMVEAENGDIYMMVDLFPGGVAINTAPRRPDNASGYREIEGKQRLVLYTGVGDAQADDNYAYYVGEFGEPVEGKRFAPVLDKNDKSVAYYVDDHYYLYTADKQPMYCRQLGSDKFVHQNVFFYNAKLHVRDATYLWVIKSTDSGDSWSAPMIMNPQVRKTVNADQFYGVGPGAGLSFVDANGTNVVLLQAYTFSNQKTSFIYSADNGATWHRAPDATTGNHWSSESALVQVDAATVRQFYRDGYNALNYTDYTWDAAKKEFTRAGDPVAVPGASKTSNNQLSAIRYSKLVNGKPAFMVSTANGGGANRHHGYIYTLSLEADKTMKVIHTYQVPNTESKYGYSSLTEMADGRIALLYEGTVREAGNGSSGEDIYFEVLAKDKFLPEGAELGGNRTIEVPLYGTVEDATLPMPTAEQIAAMNAVGIVKAEVQDGKMVYTGLKTGRLTVQLDKNAALTLHVVKRYNEKNVTLNKQQSETFAANGTISYQSNPAVVQAAVTEQTKNSVYGYTGTNASYNGKQELLSSALHTFKKSGDKYEISAPAANGEKVWLNPDGNPGFPTSNSAVAITLEEKANNEFAIKGATRYLYFHRGNDNRFDRNSSDAPQCSFLLYRPAKDGDTASTEIPGYVRVNKLADIQDGGQYLVAAKADNGTYFVLRPSLDGGNKYAHALKVDPVAKPEVVGYTLTLTGLTAGKAVVVAGDTAYLVTVPAESYTVTYTDGVEDAEVFADQTYQVEEGKETPVFNGTPAREGYVFAGWTPAVAETVTADATYTAVWTPIPKYTVTYTDGVKDAEIFADQTYQVEEGKATPAFNGTPTRKGYVFAGWTPAVAETVTANATYTATWTSIPKYTVTYTDGVKDAEIFADQTYQVEEGKATPAFNGTPTRKGYVFAGWTPAVAETVTANATYTATWTPEEVKPEPTPKPTPEPTPDGKPEPTPKPTPEVKPDPTPTAKPETDNATPAPTQKPSYGAPTGDTTNTTLWIVLLIVSGGLAGGIYFLSKKNKTQQGPKDQNAEKK